jgi:hypothetical protein
MAEEDILTREQRLDVAAFADVPPTNELNDEELLARAAEKIGLTGELAVDPDGILELEREQLLAVLEAVPPEDAHLVERPDLLYLAVYVRPGSDDERRELENAELLETGAGEDELEDGWTYAWWGGMCTRLPRDTDLPTQLSALHRALTEAEAVMQRRSLEDFFERMQWLDNDAVS